MGISDYQGLRNSLCYHETERFGIKESLGEALVYRGGDLSEGTVISAHKLVSIATLGLLMSLVLAGRSLVVRGYSMSIETGNI